MMGILSAVEYERENDLVYQDKLLTNTLNTLGVSGRTVQPQNRAYLYTEQLSAAGTVPFICPYDLVLTGVCIGMEVYDAAALSRGRAVMVFNAQYIAFLRVCSALGVPNSEHLYIPIPNMSLKKGEIITIQTSVTIGCATCNTQYSLFGYIVL